MKDDNIRIFCTIITFILLLLSLFLCCDIFDLRLKIKNNTTEVIFWFINTNSNDSLAIGEYQSCIYAQEFWKVPWPNDFEKYLNRWDGNITFNFLYEKDSKAKEEYLREKVIKSIVINKKVLDSLNWIIEVP